MNWRRGTSGGTDPNERSGPVQETSSELRQQKEALNEPATRRPPLCCASAARLDLKSTPMSVVDSDGGTGESLSFNRQLAGGG